MARFTSTVDVRATTDQVWARMTDWPTHGRFIPLTSVRVTGDRPDGVGATFVGRTGIGPIGFDDPMEIVEWTPPAGGSPGRCAIRKLGRVVLGSASFEVRDRPGGGSTVSWTEDVQLAPVRLTRWLDGAIRVGGRIGFDRALRTMARQVEAEVRPGG